MTDWEIIVRDHGPMAYMTAWRILGHRQDTEDVVQDAFADALRLSQRQHVGNWGGLLRHLITCRALDRLRSRHRSDVALASEPFSRPSDDPEVTASARELAQRLRASIDKLSNREASVFCLRYFGDMENSAIADTLDISVDAVATALSKARVRLKQLLGVEGTNRKEKML